MTFEPEPTRDPRAVPLGMLRRYLRAQNWRQLAIPRPDPGVPTGDALGLAGALLRGRQPLRTRDFDVFEFSEEGYEAVELVLPKQERQADFLSGIERAVMTLSALENRDPQSVISSIRSIGFDAVHTRIPDAMVFDDTIHLEVAASYTAGIKSLLAATATTELNPAPYFLRLLREGSDYADRCRFGHTFRGSFGFTVESTVAGNDSPTLPGLPQAPPFERRVVQRLVRGVRSIYQAVAADDISIITANAPSAFGANACESLANLIESTSYNSLAFSFSFSPEWRPADDVALDNGFVVGPRHVEATREAAKSLRSAPVQRPEKVHGRVKWLESEDDPSDLLNPAGSREIAVIWSSIDFGDIAVEMRLNAADYLVAHQAHGRGRPVMVSGTLEKRGRKWILSDPVSFTST